MQRGGSEKIYTIQDSFLFSIVSTDTRIKDKKKEQFRVKVPSLEKEAKDATLYIKFPP